MVMVSEIIICNISASRKPVPDEIGGMEDAQRTSQKHDCLKELSCLVLWHRHSIAYVRKCPTDGSKLFCNPIHTGQRGFIPKPSIRLGVREKWLEVIDRWLAVCALCRQSHH